LLKLFALAFKIIGRKGTLQPNFGKRGQFSLY
jgi:hypothetical protein